ncbi:MAG: prepilin-type N-terminal cleavage/methylation domain-containing protein [Burkholderiaceae bacterium]|nr:MAG: prepilin-type N-terminal cleavage/methylation domain-containing protein [Burkholderiaceae bacterium]
MLPPVACSLRVAASPLKGATPAARPSRFRGVLRTGHAARAGWLAQDERGGRLTKTHKHTAPPRGFTLIELLVAISILAVIAVLSWRGLEGMTRAVAQTRERSDQLLTLQTGLDQWTVDLDALMQQPRMTALDWNGNVLRMTRLAPNPADGMLVVAWARRDVNGTGQWLRWQSAPLLTRGDLDNAWSEAALWGKNPSNAEMQREVTITPLVDWQVYYFRNNAWTNPLSSSESTVATNPALPAQAALNASVPDGVRLMLRIPPGQALSGTITRDWVRPTLGGNKS